MIYLVTNQLELFNSENYKIITVEESLKLFENVKTIQFDTETTGLCHQLDSLLCAQIGNKKLGIQLVIDCSTISIKHYKNLIESCLVVGHNLKFDLQWLYNYGIVPLKVYDTMIIEQLLYLGFPFLSLSPEEYFNNKCDFPYLEKIKLGKVVYELSFSLKAVAQKRLGIDIDKSTRGEIIWRGLDTKVIEYAAGDVEFLEDIAHSQMEECVQKNCVIGAKLECGFLPAISYLEWCGVKLDENKWKNKMERDQKGLNEAKAKLDSFITSNSKFSKYTYINLQGDLFNGFDTEPKCLVNWSSSKQVIEIAKILGFNTTTQDKKTGESKDSVLEKHLASQKGICDDFLDYYFKYQEKAKLVSSFGQGHLNDINPKTGRLYTTWKQLGAASGRMSCGSTQSNTTLARYKGLKPSECSYKNLQQLPHDAETRACFVAEKGNVWISCDYSAEEARLAGDIYNDQAIKEIFLKGIDSHSMYAKIFFKEELKDIPVEKVKELRPDLRNKSKGPEFALNFGGTEYAIKQALNCSEEEARQIKRNYEEGFKGTAEYARVNTEKLKQTGYVLINPITGHKMYWWDFSKWKERQDSKEFWESYKYHRGTGDAIDKEAKMHFKAIAKWGRMVRNGPTQGTAACILKRAMTRFFKYIIENELFNKVKFCTLVHDEVNIECPEKIKTIIASKLQEYMEESAAYYCKSLPIPAVPEIASCWVH